MTLYAATEISEFDGDLIELYTFTIQGVDTFVTSADQTISFGGDSYVRTSIRRSTLTENSQLNPNGITLVVPRDNAIALRFLSFPPSFEFEITIQRKHRQDTDSLVVFVGIVKGVRWSGSEAFLECEPRIGKLGRLGLRYKLQTVCNHMLYDDRCGVLITDNEASSGQPLRDQNVNISDVSTDGKRLKANVFSFVNVDLQDLYSVGYCIRENTGEKRFITIHDGSIGSPNAFIDLSRPFNAFAGGGGDLVTVIAGCKKTATVCDFKFDVFDQFGGFPDLPLRNPVVQGVG